MFIKLCRGKRCSNGVAIGCADIRTRHEAHMRSGGPCGENRAVPFGGVPSHQDRRHPGGGAEEVAGPRWPRHASLRRLEDKEGVTTVEADFLCFGLEEPQATN